MKLIDQRTKKIMEECKIRARDAGLSFQNETLEYIVTNRDLLELTPKSMIPTLYDFWIHDLQALQEKRMYELYPSNPYETVINTRPAVSFYNDNNPDWLNVMIFYHVIAHIDFFQNNLLFRNTWDDDFGGLALADKRLIARIRSERGRYVDYVIEFARSIDNLVGYYDDLTESIFPHRRLKLKKIDFYFDIFLSKIKKTSSTEYLKEIERYNKTKKEFPDTSENMFFSEIEKIHPEFDPLYRKELKEKGHSTNVNRDILKYIVENSAFVNDKENEWMKLILEVVRRTGLYFEPQRRTKIMNEGWASYWHEKLFLDDDRIKGHEVDFAFVNARVMPMPRAGLNPYALGWRMYCYAEELANKGKRSFDFQKVLNMDKREKYNKDTKTGLQYLFNVRENFNDFTFINTFVDQDFVDTYKVFVLGKRMNPNKGVWEYYVKSRDADQYKNMLVDSLYHPPYITVDESKMEKEELYLHHSFEGKPLVGEYIPNTLMGLEYLWGKPVHLETSEVDVKSVKPKGDAKSPTGELDLKYVRVLYTMSNRKLTRKMI